MHRSGFLVPSKLAPICPHTYMPITKDQQEILAEIFSESERPDKMSIKLNADRSIIIVYDDLDDEWFNELLKTQTAPE